MVPHRYTDDDDDDYYWSVATGHIFVHSTGMWPTNMSVVGVCLCGQLDGVVSCENAVNNVSDSSEQM